MSSAQTDAIWLLCLLWQHWELGSNDDGSWHETGGIGD